MSGISTNAMSYEITVATRCMKSAANTVVKTADTTMAVKTVDTIMVVTMRDDRASMTSSPVRRHA